MANSRDMVAKGRARVPRGERNGQAKLTNEIAAKIRADSRPQKVIASELGLHQSTISKIKTGVTFYA